MRRVCHSHGAMLEKYLRFGPFARRIRIQNVIKYLLQEAQALVRNNRLIRWLQDKDTHRFKVLHAAFQLCDVNKDFCQKIKDFIANDQFEVGSKEAPMRQNRIIAVRFS